MPTGVMEDYMKIEKIGEGVFIIKEILQAQLKP